MNEHSINWNSNNTAFKFLDQITSIYSQSEEVKMVLANDVSFSDLREISSINCLHAVLNSLIMRREDV